ncbi:putative F420-0 ABC transporter substrate-binding protein [Mycetocola zhadangensis]|uniref:Putative F420-0 ABC transporter substrate-binding protein n=1 Tax=Mycetocola zhadangensis TaxID=1164595 RepID=A0A3L7J2J1_9MICO|nr:putative F420-0 ABC transporter substrate-binding protein [Mycetocola zhadangensis]RLQ84684.1 putative F420-0 ABC transporter substrate-binding protein [Mycetocola zhadangensis]GGE92980.1 lipoprotein [Mycetocola zhadangensis]
MTFPTRLSRFGRPLAAIALAASLLAVSACASPAASVSPSKTATPETAGYPLTLDNCGTELTIEKAPERVLSIKSTTTEMLLALGLEDSLIGRAFPDGPLPEDLGGTDVPVISDKVPGQEAVLDLEPDFIYAGWESNFSADGAGERETLQSLGVNTYVSPAACQEADYAPESLSFDDVFAQIEEVGSIFDVTGAATELVDAQKVQLESIEPVEDVSALWYSSGSDTPYVGAGSGAPQMIMDAVGLTNIAADVDESWTSFNWEAVVDANPDVIVLVVSDWGTAEKKIGVLESNPATANLDAVVNKRYVTVPFAAGEAGVRNVEAATSIAAQLGDLGL